jgi:TRAP-type C4-dicarboxylate transport system permease small subunit
VTDAGRIQFEASTRGGRGPLAQFVRVVAHAEEIVCYTFLVLLVVTTSLQVFTRYVLNMPFTWTEEVARMLFTWIVFLGAALIVKRSSHISIDIVVKALPPGPRRWLRVVSHLITLVIVVTLAVKGVQLLQITGASASPALNIPWVYIYAAFPLGMALMAVRYGQGLLRLLRSPASPGDGLEVPRAPESPI